MTPDRKTVLAACRALLEERRAGYLRELASLDEASAGETKSSAGDKYETAREMIAQSRRLMERNLAEAEAGLEALRRMASAPAGGKVASGSLVETNQGWHLVGLSIGEVDIPGAAGQPGGFRVRTVSLASPMGQALRGKEAGARIPWRSATLEIIGIAG